VQPHNADDICNFDDSVLADSVERLALSCSPLDDFDSTPKAHKPKASRFLAPPPPSAAARQSWKEESSPSVSSSSSESLRSGGGIIRGINIRTCGSGESDFSVKSFTGGAQPGVYGNGARAIARLREQLLERFRALHDAFGNIDRFVLMERMIHHDQLKSALLSQLGGPGGLRSVDDCEDIFAALVGSGNRGERGVSLADVWDSLVSGSPETVLWELRCRLVFAGICPHNHCLALHKTAQVVQRQRDSRLKNASWRRLRRPTRGVRRSQAAQVMKTSP